MTEQARETPEPLTPDPEYDKAYRAGWEAAFRATPDPAEPCGPWPGFADPCILPYRHDGPHRMLRDATPDPAERIEGLRDRAQRQGTWGIEYGDDRFYDDVMAALRAVTPDPADHDRQAVQGTHLFDESCPGCAALSDTTEGQS
jgi:hypothetical protein